MTCCVIQVLFDCGMEAETVQEQRKGAQLKKRALKNKALGITFNEKDLTDYVTGFHKRKKKRRKEAQKQQNEALRRKRTEERKRVLSLCYHIIRVSRNLDFYFILFSFAICFYWTYFAEEVGKRTCS